MAIVRWSPARDLLTMRDLMDRVMEDTFRTSWGGRTGWSETVVEMPLDVHQTDKEYVVKATLPGVRPEDVDVSVVGETLTIKATAQEEKDVKDESWLLKESRYTAFSRTITLPTEVQADKVDATIEHGILVLKLPKAEAVVPKAIKVKLAGK
jgi:HSP20 family protein